MLDISHTLVHKLTMQIVRRQEGSLEIGVADLVKGVLYDRLAEIYHLNSDWRFFAVGGKLTSAEDVLKGQTVSVEIEDDNIWVAYLNVKDPELTRRRWVYYLCLRTANEDESMLYYAKCCYNHMAGSIMEAKPIPTERDMLPDPLFTNPHLRCMCGQYTLPNEPKELTHSSLPDLLNLLRDDTRRQPVFLITCGWYVSPQRLFEVLMGNAVVYWCENSSVVMRLNGMLPQNMYTAWDSVRIFMPDAGDKTFHPVYSIDEIRQMGIERFCAGLRQAYCQSLRSEERRNFLTVEDVCAARRRQQIEALTGQVAERDVRLAALSKQQADLKKTNSVLKEQLEQLTLTALPKDAAEYESMLNEAIHETDELRQGIQRLTSQLCADMGASFHPDRSEPVAAIQELAHTIHACLQRVADKGGH